MLKIRLTNKAIKIPLIITPLTNSTHSGELNDCLIKLDAILSSASTHDLLKISIFINSINLIHFQALRKQLLELITSHFGPDLPIVSFIPQPPAEKFNVILEVLLFDNSYFKCHIDFYHKQNSSYSIIANEDYEEIYGVTAHTQSKNQSNYAQTSSCFDEIDEILLDNGLTFADIHRQWSYIGHINDFSNMNGKMIENYQQFNISRARYFSKCEWKNGFPSATGIGANVPGCTIEFTASPINGVDVVIPLHNPKQLDAHRYSDKYQIRNMNLLDEMNYENTPKFERGKIVITGNLMDVYISGTAAILGEDSINQTVEKQTEITLNNIAELYSKHNLFAHGLDIDGDLPKFALLRVYIKNREDFSVVQDICNNFYPDVPTLIVEADVCRKELLVEIEAYANTLVDKL